MMFDPQLEYASTTNQKSYNQEKGTKKSFLITCVNDQIRELSS